jgi:membrane-bound lytic murein transglycosylase B
VKTSALLLVLLAACGSTPPPPPLRTTTEAERTRWHQAITLVEVSAKAGGVRPQDFELALKQIQDLRAVVDASGTTPVDPTDLGLRVIGLGAEWLVHRRDGE